MSSAKAKSAESNCERDVIPLNARRVAVLRFLKCSSLSIFHYVTEHNCRYIYSLYLFVYGKNDELLYHIMFVNEELKVEVGGTIGRDRFSAWMRSPYWEQSDSFVFGYDNYSMLLLSCRIRIEKTVVVGYFVIVLMNLYDKWSLALYGVGCVTTA